MRTHLFFPFVLAVLIGACEGGGDRPFSVELVDSAGGRPFSGDGTLRIEVALEGVEPAPAPGLSAIVGGAFQLDLPVSSYEATTVVHAEIEATDGETLIGATTPFRPAYVPGGLVRVVMSAPRECVTLSSPSLRGGRRWPGIALVEANLVSIGGVLESGDPVAGVNFYTPVQLTVPSVAAELETLSPPFGATRLFPIAGTTEILAIDAAHAIRYETGGRPTTSRARAQPLHAGAGAGSAVAPLDDYGVAVVGGRDGSSDVDTISIVRPLSEAAERLTLSSSRRNASAVSLRGGILVAGGQPSGETLFEWIARDGTQRIAFGDAIERRDGTLVASPDGTQALYYLGRDDAGTLATTSFVVSGCPACVATPGPAVMAPRAAAVTARRARATVVIGGEDMAGVASAVVEEVRFVAGTPIVVRMGELREGRRELAAIPMWSDVVLVTGGVNPGGNVLDSMELCFPETLDAPRLPDL